MSPDKIPDNGRGQKRLWENQDLSIFGSTFGDGPHLIIYATRGGVLQLRPEESLTMVACVFKWYLETFGIGGTDGK